MPTRFVCKSSELAVKFFVFEVCNGGLISVREGSESG
jgi:hypothetical protein